VWWDEWEIRVGDSLMTKVQEGIVASSYLAVVLTPTSVSSAWVKEELHAALHRQLEDKGIRVLPILLAPCEIPPFLAEKKYADFTRTYESGLTGLVKSIEPIPTGSHSGGEEGDYHHDWAIEWGVLEGLHAIRATITTHSPMVPYSVGCRILVVANEVLSHRLSQFEEQGSPWATRWLLLGLAEELIAQVQTVILIEGDLEVTHNHDSFDPKIGAGVHITVSARRLGQDPEDDVLYEWASVFRFIAARHREGIRAALDPDEARRFEQWRRANPLR
jgi:hypothetical protein